MIKNRNETSAAMDKALKNLEQAKARYEAERKKENEKRRKAQNHHKYLMGGIVAKYFPECYQYEEKELNVILSAALASAECRQAVENVKGWRKMRMRWKLKKTETAVTPMKRRQKKTAADTPIQKILRVAVFRRECKQYLREYGFTPVMGCAQIDHTPYGLVRSPRAPAVGVACLAPVKRGNNLSPPSAALPTPLYPLHLPVTRKTHPAFVHLQRLFLQPSILR